MHKPNGIVSEICAILREGARSLKKSDYRRYVGALGALLVVICVLALFSVSRGSYYFDDALMTCYGEECALLEDRGYSVFDKVFVFDVFAIFMWWLGVSIVLTLAYCALYVHDRMSAMREN